jgi:hypothetical protein
LRHQNGKYSPKVWDCNASQAKNAGKSDDSNEMLHPFGEYLLRMKNAFALIFLCGAYCYVPQAFATTGNLLHTFNDPTVTSSDHFGWSVA